MIDIGYCQCGCGLKTKISNRTREKYGWIKGQPLRYINRHHMKNFHHSEETKIKMSKLKKNFKGTAIERFYKKIKILENGYWLWQDYILNTGYGQFKVDRKQKTAHRFIYEYYYGKIPKGLTLDHICRNRACANPKHLEVVTLRENILRGIGFASINHKKTHCVNGHPLLGENLYLYHGTRTCKICRKKQLIESRKRIKEQKINIEKALGINGPRLSRSPQPT